MHRRRKQIQCHFIFQKKSSKGNKIEKQLLKQTIIFLFCVQLLGSGVFVCLGTLNRIVISVGLTETETETE